MKRISCWWYVCEFNSLIVCMLILINVVVILWLCEIWHINHPVSIYTSFCFSLNFDNLSITIHSDYNKWLFRIVMKGKLNLLILFADYIQKNNVRSFVFFSFYIISIIFCLIGYVYPIRYWNIYYSGSCNRWDLLNMLVWFWNSVNFNRL